MYVVAGVAGKVDRAVEHPANVRPPGRDNAGPGRGGAAESVILPAHGSLPSLSATSVRIPTHTSCPATGFRQPGSQWFPSEQSDQTRNPVRAIHTNIVPMDAFSRSGEQPGR